MTLMFFGVIKTNFSRPRSKMTSLLPFPVSVYFTIYGVQGFLSFDKYEWYISCRRIFLNYFQDFEIFMSINVYNFPLNHHTFLIIISWPKK